MASPAASSTSQAGGSGSKKAEAIDDLLQRLGIEEDEFDDLVFEEQESAPKEGMKWTALARIHTTNFFSPQTFEQHMRIAWSPAKEVKFQHLEENLFSIQCFCLGDWIKVEKGGPWLFRQNPVCIEKYDGLAPIESVDLNFFATWIQIHRLPIGYRNDTLVKNLTERNIGKVLEVQMNAQGMGKFVRARVKLDVRKVLARFVTISRDGKREFYQVKYEKMPRYCGACGFVGHSHLECGTGEHDENNLKWGIFCKPIGLPGMAVELVVTVEVAVVAVEGVLTRMVMEREEDVEPMGLGVEVVWHPGDIMLSPMSMGLLRLRIR
jgi:hypothetical protein